MFARRRTLLVDQFIQLDLALRLVAYWAGYAAANFCLLVGIPMFWARHDGPEHFALGVGSFDF